MSRSESAAWAAQHHVSPGRVGDGPQLAKRVSVAQGVCGLGVAVVGCPAVMHRDPGEGGSAPAASIASRPRLGCTVISVNFPDDAECTQASFPPRPEPGLVEVRDIGGDQCLADRLQRHAQPPGDPPDHAGDRAGRDLDAEQLAQRLAGAASGQELAVPQVGRSGADPRPVVHRRAGSRGRRRGADGAARASARNQPVLGDQRLDVLGQVDHLAALGAGHLRVRQPAAAASAPARLVGQHMVRVIGHLQRRPWLALRPVRLPAALAAQRPWGRVWPALQTMAASMSSAGSGPAGRAGPRPPRPAP